MTLTHAQLLDAVRAAGRDRESFTCADVRQQLGLATQDRKQLNRFSARFRALQKDAASEIEKLGSNCYRLRATADEPPAAQQSRQAVPTESGEPSGFRFEEVVELVTRDLEVPIPAPASVESSLEAAAVAASRFVEPAKAGVVVSAPALDDVDPLHRHASAPGEQETAAQPPVTHVSKPRSEWLNRMARFFSRRPSKTEATHEIAVGV